MTREAVLQPNALALPAGGDQKLLNKLLYAPTGSGARYDIAVAQGSAGAFEWVEQWDEDEGGGACPTSTIAESHNDTVQHVLWDISLPASS